ncbi:uncharacterized protein EV422DRAFT_567397 [Fimicolochytrium jonesii]|uniref:uncharacterized protein n=1 Tax=Fimicolochytrium jonesii TaxID=1396493 RepID=UPI0022FDE0B5|nr:uncharacterized protein EV422DRAFT_567397 [Fimicolochytrium jonesii]KAI8821073.1 hypothetical protein EV422DRAFT_567397 [Fimicolochytrium jonesii]
MALFTTLRRRPSHRAALGAASPLSLTSTGSKSVSTFFTFRSARNLSLDDATEGAVELSDMSNYPRTLEAGYSVEDASLSLSSVLHAAETTQAAQPQLQQLQTQSSLPAPQITSSRPSYPTSLYSYSSSPSVSSMDSAATGTEREHYMLPMDYAFGGDEDDSMPSIVREAPSSTEALSPGIDAMETDDATSHPAYPLSPQHSGPRGASSSHAGPFAMRGTAERSAMGQGSYFSADEPGGPGGKFFQNKEKIADKGFFNSFGDYFNEASYA